MYAFFVNTSTGNRHQLALSQQLHAGVSMQSCVVLATVTVLLLLLLLLLFLLCSASHCYCNAVFYGFPKKRKHHSDVVS